MNSLYDRTRFRGILFIFSCNAAAVVVTAVCYLLHIIYSTHRSISNSTRSIVVFV